MFFSLVGEKNLETDVSAFSLQAVSAFRTWLWKRQTKEATNQPATNQPTGTQSQNWVQISAYTHISHLPPGKSLCSPEPWPLWLPHLSNEDELEPCTQITLHSKAQGSVHPLFLPTSLTLPNPSHRADYQGRMALRGQPLCVAVLCCCVWLFATPWTVAC